MAKIEFKWIVEFPRYNKVGFRISIGRVDIWIYKNLRRFIKIVVFKNV